MAKSASKKACGVRYKNPVSVALTLEEENCAWVDTKAAALGGVGRSKVINHLIDRIRDLEVTVPEAYRALMAAF